MVCIQPKVLIVDDEEHVCQLLNDALSQRGYLCHSVFNANDALAKLGVEDFDVVLLDIRMPVKSGMEMLKEMLSTHSNSVVIMTTAVNDVDTSLKAIKLGASDYIVKPFHLDKVDTAIRTALEAKQAAKGSPITVSTVANPKAEKETKEIYRKAQMEAAQIVNQAKKRGKRESNKEVAKIIGEANQGAVHTLDEATEKAAKIIATAREEGEQIVRELKQTATREIAERTREVDQYIKEIKVESSRAAEQFITETGETARRKAGPTIQEAAKTVVVTDEQVEIQAQAEMPPDAPVVAQQTEVTEVGAEAQVTPTEEHGELFQGEVKLEIVGSIDYKRVVALKQYLLEVTQLVVLSVGGTGTGTEIIVFADGPLDLMQILRAMPMVKQVGKKGENIEITLKSS
jgi:DNA-binding response OmpR family regulator